jgi:hypothetical protein
MIVREIQFADGDANPGLVVRALEVLGFEGRAWLKGPVRANGKVVGCFVAFHDEPDADKFIAAWNGFLELKKTGRPGLAFAPSYAMSSFSAPELSVRLSGGEGEASPPSQPSPALRGGKGSE